jgi:hypothetical protein
MIALTIDNAFLYYGVSRKLLAREWKALLPDKKCVVALQTDIYRELWDSLAFNVITGICEYM